MKNIKTFRKVRASIINEKLKAKKPSDKITIDVDLDYNPDSDEQQDRDSEKIFKKFKLDVTPNGATDVSFDMSGKKQDLINYLQSKYYSFDDEDIRDLYPELLETVKEGFLDKFKKRGPSLDEPVWFEAIADAALAQLQKHHKWKDMELAAMGPGNKKNYMDMAITSSKKRGPEYEFKVHFDKDDKVTKIENVTPE